MKQNDYINALNRTIEKAAKKVKSDPKDLFTKITHKALTEHLDAIDRGEMEPWTEIRA